MPNSQEASVNIHEIGSLRGFMKACLEIYDEANEIMMELTAPETKK
jgi:hypothetical protein